MRAIAAQLPRSYEAVVRGRLKMRVGRIVYLAFNHAQTELGFAYPRELREALIASDPERFLWPKPADLRYQWAVARLDTLDAEEMYEFVVDAWRMVVPKRVAAAYADPRLVADPSAKSSDGRPVLD